MRDESAIPDEAAVNYFTCPSILPLEATQGRENGVGRESWLGGVDCRAVDRLIDLPGCNNFRDLGGYPAASGRRVRWRQLFRSDALHELTPAGVRRFVDELRIGMIVDLRSTGELAADGRGPLASEPLEFRHLPLFDGAIREERAAAAEFTLADRYFLMAEFAKEPIARVVTALAASDAPAAQ